MAAALHCEGVIFSPIGLNEPQNYSCSGVYMFCRRDIANKIKILYIGEAENIANRLKPSHEHWSEAMLLGMNEIHIYLLAETKTQRLNIETYLRSRIVTPLNRQGGSAGEGLFGLLNK